MLACTHWFGYWICLCRFSGSACSVSDVLWLQRDLLCWITPEWTIPSLTHSSAYTHFYSTAIFQCVCVREAWCWVTAVKGWVTTGSIILHPSCPHNRTDQYLTALKIAAIFLASLPLSLYFHAFVYCSLFSYFSSINLTVVFNSLGFTDKTKWLSKLEAVLQIANITEVEKVCTF